MPCAVNRKRNHSAVSVNLFATGRISAPVKFDYNPRYATNDNARFYMSRSGQADESVAFVDPGSAAAFLYLRLLRTIPARLGRVVWRRVWPALLLFAWCGLGRGHGWW